LKEEKKKKKKRKRGKREEDEGRKGAGTIGNAGSFRERPLSILNKGKKKREGKGKGETKKKRGNAVCGKRGKRGRKKKDTSIFKKPTSLELVPTFSFFVHVFGRKKKKKKKKGGKRKKREETLCLTLRGDTFRKEKKEKRRGKKERRGTRTSAAKVICRLQDSTAVAWRRYNSSS